MFISESRFLTFSLYNLFSLDLGLSNSLHSVPSYFYLLSSYFVSSPRLFLQSVQQAFRSFPPPGFALESQLFGRTCGETLATQATVSPLPA